MKRWLKQAVAEVVLLWAFVEFLRWQKAKFGRWYKKNGGSST